MLLTRNSKFVLICGRKQQLKICCFNRVDKICMKSTLLLPRNTRACFVGALAHAQKIFPPVQCHTKFN